MNGSRRGLVALCMALWQVARLGLSADRVQRRRGVWAVPGLLWWRFLHYIMVGFNSQSVVSACHAFMLDMLCSALVSAKRVKQRPGGGYLTRCVSVVNPENTAQQEKAHFKKTEHIKKDYN